MALDDGDNNRKALNYDYVIHMEIRCDANVTRRNFFCLIIITFMILFYYRLFKCKSPSLWEKRRFTSTNTTTSTTQLLIVTINGKRPN